jgi:hypothetical protein
MMVFIVVPQKSTYMGIDHINRPSWKFNSRHEVNWDISYTSF